MKSLIVTVLVLAWVAPAVAAEACGHPSCKTAPAPGGSIPGDVGALAFPGRNGAPPMAPEPPATMATSLVPPPVTALPPAAAPPPAAAAAPPAAAAAAVGPSFFFPLTIGPPSR